MRIKFKKFSQRGRTPTKETAGSAGFDLYFAETCCIPPCSSAPMQTDVGFKIPRGYFGKIHPPSSLANQFISVGGGVIDSDYRGNVIVIFFNFSSNYYHIHKGDKIAQIVFQKIANHVKFQEVGNFGNNTSRGTKGFGSTNLTKCCLNVQ